MPKARGNMTVRVVPLQSPEAGDARVGGTVAERIALVAALSESHWELTRRPRPRYDRATMPVRVSSLGIQSAPD